MTFETLDEFCGEKFWDENLSWNTTNPDLTVCLQQTLLIWIPCGILWLLLPVELYLQRTSVGKLLPWTGTNVTRMMVALSLALLCFANLMDVTFNGRFENLFTANVVAETTKCATFILSVILMKINKKRGRHTSGVLFTFWFCLMICEICVYRSSFMQIKSVGQVPNRSSFIFKMIYFPLVIVSFCLSCFADIRYREVIFVDGFQQREKECPELSASFLSKLAFWWFNDMTVLGYRKPLVIEDLWDLNPEDKTERVSLQFEKYWRGKQSEKLDHIEFRVDEVNGSKPIPSDDMMYFPITESRQKPVHIARSLCKAFWPYFFIGTICKFVYDCLQFTNPIIFKMLIEYVQTSDPLWKGIVYSLLLFMNGCVQSVLLGVYFHRMFVLGMRIRTALVSAIYDKSLMLSAIARRSSTVGEIVNLMSVDSQRFMDLMTYLNLLWSAPFQIIIALVMLWNILGPSVLAGLFVMVILIPLNAFIASRAKTRQVKQMKRKDERVKLINEVLSGIKVLKLYAWEETFKEQIIGIRNKEVDQLKGIAYLNTYGLILWNCSSLLVALASFACFVLSDGRNTLDATTAFVSLSLFNYLRFPLTMLPNMISTMVMTAVSVKRINKFLNSEELEEYVVRVYDKDSDDIIIRNGDFLWAKDEGESEKLTLSNINLNVKRGSLVAVVGQVGSGKSSLLSAILGDMEKMRGSVYISGSTAYVSQQAWIQNASLKNNILFLQPLHRQFYQDVLDACGLLPDLAVLPGGDSTEIGEKGINLSGGQKQRVSLARAVYSSADIYLLDDPLSAVDSHVGRHIFDRVIGPDGLLKGKTRILVTHGLTYLPQMDIILVIKNNTIAEMGSYQQLIDSRGPFSEFLSQYLLQNDIAEENREVLEDISSKNPELLRSLSSGSEACSDATETQHTSLLSISALPKQPSIHKEKSVSKEKIKQEDKQFNLIETEKAETGKVHWEVYINYMKAVGIKWVLLILIAHIIWQIFGVGSNVWLSEWGNDSLQPNAAQNIHLRNIRLGVYGALGFAQGVAIFIGSFGIAYGTLQASNRLHQGLLLNVLKSPMSFFDTTPLGRIVNRFAKDVDTVDVTIPMTLRSWMSCLLQVIATVIVISVQTPIFLTVFVPVGILYYFIQVATGIYGKSVFSTISVKGTRGDLNFIYKHILWSCVCAQCTVNITHLKVDSAATHLSKRFYVSTSRQLKRLESITRSPIYSHFSETLAGCSTIRAYNAQQSFRKQSSDLVDKNQVCYFPSIVSNRWLAIRLELCGNLIIFSAALFAVLGRDHLDPGRVGLSVSYALMITATLNWLVRMTSELETNIVAVERILEYTTTPTEASWVLSNVQIPDGWPQEGHVQLQNYSTRYREGLELVLKEITCDFAPREKVGIVGRTGAGKSSLTLSLFRIIEAAGGSILIDNVPIQNIGLHQLRTKITIIPQDPVLFSGTLRMNLDPFSWYSDDQIWEALAHAHLQNFVTKLNNGLLHEIAEGGENLSVGQRQLVCLARALLRKTKILVLDEATAAVDLETDDLIQATIRQEFADCAVLTIAHRLNTVMDYDRIMVLSHGNIQEFDSPEILLKNKKSEFYKMAKDAGLV